MKLFKSVGYILFVIALLSFSIFAPTNTLKLEKKEYYVSSSEIDQYSSIFVDASLEFGVPASILMAMAIEETSFGTAGVGKSKNNWFGMEASSLYPTDPNYTGRFEVYPNAEASIRDAARLLGSPTASYRITNILINNRGNVDASYLDIARSITAHWCVNEPGAPCSYDATKLLQDIETYGLKKYDTDLANLSDDDLKTILEKYYGKNAQKIPGYDKPVTGWNGQYGVPEISDNEYNSIYFNSSYYGDYTKGYVYLKYAETSMWEQIMADSEEEKVDDIIREIFIQGEKLYGDGKIHASDFIFNGSEQSGPSSGIISGEFSGLPLPTGSFTCSSGFGNRGNIGVSGASTNHKAIDLPVPTGTTVFTVGDGKVTHAGPLGTCGYAVKVDHGNGMVTRYCHLSKVNVSLGQKVSAGEVIAFSGNTGVSSGPHLDFQVVIDGKAVDPRNVIEGLKGLKCSNGL